MANADKVIVKKHNIKIGGKNRKIILNMYSFVELEELNEGQPIGEIFTRIGEGKQSFRDVLNVAFVGLNHYEDINSPKELALLIPGNEVMEILPVIMGAVSEAMEGTPKN